MFATNISDELFGSLQGESEHRSTPPKFGHGGACMSSPTTTSFQKPSFSCIETGLKFASTQAAPLGGISAAPLYHEWPRLQVPRNNSHYNFEHRASFHGRG